MSRVKPVLWVAIKDYEAVRRAMDPLVPSVFSKVVPGCSVEAFKEEMAAKTTEPITLVMGDPKGGEILRAALDTCNDRLMWVHSLWTGVDGFKISDISKDRLKCPVTNARGVFAGMLAEHVIFALFYFLRKTTVLQRNQINREWKPHTNGFLREGRMGIIGYGDIAKCCAKHARSFEIDVVGWRRTVDAPVDELGVKVVSGQEGLDEVLGCDYVLAVLPKTDATYHMIDKSFFAKMKKNTIFINIGRGASVVEHDLADALRDGTIGAAALDVYEVEPLSKSSPLYDISTDKLLLTPHDADVNRERYFPAARHFAEKYAKPFGETGTLDHIDYLVDVSRGY